MEKIVALAKNRGFVFPGSEIYGGLANAWDYGSIGVLLKNNIKKHWWKKFVTESEYNVGIDSAILMNSEVWEASGHTSNFADPLIDCKECKSRYRADELVEDYIAGLKQNGENGSEDKSNFVPEFQEPVDSWGSEKLEKFIAGKKLACPKCGKSDWTNIRQFNLMFKTYQGATSDSAAEIFLRPETAQGIFVNFRNVARTSRKKVPFGIAQIGKSFRNEITPGNFIFRTREFEQMELEFFCEPGKDMEWFSYWRKFAMDFLLALNIPQEKLRFHDHAKEELSHYSNATTDIQFNFPFGWGELWGIADRTDYDLKAHMEKSGKDLSYLDPATNERWVPFVIEPSLGVDRLLLALLASAYDDEKLEDGETRTVLRFAPEIAPYKAAVLPLSKKLSEAALPIYRELIKHFDCEFDDAGSIGKRYRRQDEIGTPFCVTYDFDSESDGKVTIRERDSMKQQRLPIEGVSEHVNNAIS
jgi:glycyl-tRNA synthetase